MGDVGVGWSWVEGDDTGDDTTKYAKNTKVG